VRDIVRKDPRFFVLATFAAVGLRLVFLFRFPALTPDSFVYGDIAKNWLQHGIYGLSGQYQVTPTYIRLPGYPAFLAAVFAVFGMEHYRVALVLQMFVDIGTCLVIADLTCRLVSTRAAKAAFLLAALCPFLANYTAAVLTETLEVFFTVLAVDFVIAGLNVIDAAAGWPWLGCGLATAAAILLRPDGGLLLAAIGIYLTCLLVGRIRKRSSVGWVLRGGLITLGVSLLPLIPWTLRNLHTLHRFESLAPRYANEPNAFVPMGFNRWVKTWMADYVSLDEVYWAQSTSTLDTDKFPSRAFDSPVERHETEQLLGEYNKTLQVSPDLDAKFAKLAADRIHHAPLRYYVWLPLLRIADMWLRPRTELLPLEARWWNFDDDPQWIALTLVLGVTNLLYIAAALLGLVRGRFAIHLSLLLIFVILRSAFLGTLENPEPRYTLECYPVVILLAASLVGSADFRSPLETAHVRFPGAA